MLKAAGQAFGELFSPPFRAIMLKCVFFTLALLVGLVVALEWAFAHFVTLPGWIETSIQVVGGLGLVVGSIFLIPPVTSLIAGLYLDEIADLVEKTNFPNDPPGQALPTGESIWLALRFFFVVLAVNVVALVLLLVPGINLIAFFLGNGYLLGREYCELAIMRHFSNKEAKRIRKENGTTVFLSGLVIAVVASIPLLNLVTPLFATSFMIRMWKKMARKKGIALPPSRQPAPAPQPVPQSV